MVKLSAPRLMDLISMPPSTFLITSAKVFPTLELSSRSARCAVKIRGAVPASANFLSGIFVEQQARGKLFLFQQRLLLE